MAIVYRHRRLDTFEVFYVGISKTEKRAYSKKVRNKYWKNIINKTDYNVEIISKYLSYEDAKELEMFLITEYGRKDLNTGILSNMTDGGEGVTNLIVTQETKNKISNSSKGKIKTKEHIENNRLARIGKKRSPEIKEKIKNSRVYTTLSEEVKNKIRIGHEKRRISIGLPIKDKTILKKPNCTKVKELNSGIVFKSIIEAAKFFNIGKSTIYRELNKSKIYKKGFIKLSLTDN